MPLTFGIVKQIVQIVKQRTISSNKPKIVKQIVHFVKQIVHFVKQIKRIVKQMVIRQTNDGDQECLNPMNSIQKSLILGQMEWPIDDHSVMARRVQPFVERITIVKQNRIRQTNIRSTSPNRQTQPKSSNNSRQFPAFVKQNRQTNWISSNKSGLSSNTMNEIVKQIPESSNKWTMDRQTNTWIVKQI